MRSIVTHTVTTITTETWTIRWQGGITIPSPSMEPLRDEAPTQEDSSGSGHFKNNSSEGSKV